MIAVRDRRTGETHRGRSPESIARRLYGRRATVRYSPDPNNPWEAWVTIWQPKANASSVEANWYLDEAARAAAEPEDRPEARTVSDATLARIEQYVARRVAESPPMSEKTKQRIERALSPYATPPEPR